ncbi:MAG: hypothetical protein V4506_05490 [Bacteroidota bacterium]
MKKLLSIVCLSVLMLSAKVYAQSNITWTIKDNVQKGFFKTSTTFNTHFSGFTTKAQSDVLIQKMKAFSDVASATTTNADANGNCDLKLVMKSAHEKRYYLGVAQKLGIQYVEVNGNKKTPAQWMEGKTKK